MSIRNCVIILNVAYTVSFAYVAPTVFKAVGAHLSVQLLAGLSLAGTAVLMLQAPIARWVPAKHTLYGGALLGLPQGVLILAFSTIEGVVAPLVVLKISSMISTFVSGNWSALQNEALAKVGRLSQLQTLLGSICSASTLVGTGLVFLWPPSLHTAIIIAGVTELVGLPISLITAKKILEQLPP